MRAKILDDAKQAVTADRQVLCACGCRKPTTPYKNTIPRLGHVKGEPAKYLPRHSRRTHGVWNFEVSEGCWEWRGARDVDGYGISRHDGRKTPAHRAVWLASGRDIPEGFQLDHLCRNRACVNPEHLEPVTLAENIRRASKLDWSKVRIIRASSDSGASLARQFGVSPNTIYDIRHGRIWREE